MSFFSLPTWLTPSSKLASRMLTALSLSCLLAPAAWSISQSLEQVSSLSVLRQQSPEDLRMLATLRARHQLRDQGAAFIAKVPAAASLSDAERRALAEQFFQAEIFDLSGSKPLRELVIKAKSLADTSLMPENLDDYLQNNSYTLQGVARKIQRADDLELAFDDYLKRLGKARSADEAESLRKDVGQSLQQRYQSMDLLEQGLSSLRRQRLQEADEAFDKALKLDPANDLAMTLRGLSALRMDNYDRAINDFSQALQQRPEDELLLLLRANAYTEQGILPQQALADLKILLTRNPKLGRAYFLRGQNYLLLKRCQDASADFARACDLGVKDACTADCRTQLRRRRAR